MKSEKQLKLLKDKEMAKTEFEANFCVDFEDAFNDEGIKHYWDDNTSFSEAMGMLSVAGVYSLLTDEEEKENTMGVVKNILGDVVKELEDQLSSFTIYKVVDIRDNSIIASNCETENDALKIGLNYCLASGAKPTDVAIRKYKVIKINGKENN